MILGLLISLFAFWGGKNEVNDVHAEEVVPHAVGETSATFFDTSDYYLYSRLSNYFKNIVSLKISNMEVDLPPEVNRVCAPIILKDSIYTDASGNESVPSEGVLFAYISYASDSTADNLRYDCVLYANVDKIYANENASYMFYRFNALEELDLSMLDISKTTNMKDFFSLCYSLKSIDVSNFNTSNVINMEGMFEGCHSLTKLDLTNFDTTKVTNMKNMFDNCFLLTELDISNFDTSNATNMASMFSDCKSLIEIDVTSFDTSKVTTMYGMFKNCASLTELNISNFDTSNVTNMGSMFFDCKLLTNLDVSNFNTTNVTEMSFMFKNCASLTKLDITNFDTSKVENMNSMFPGCSSLTELDVSNFNTSNVITMEFMFQDCASLTKLNLSNFNTLKVTKMTSMFNGCSSLTELDVSNFNTSNVKEMSSMFKDCTSLTKLDITNFDTSKVERMNSMFENCSSITEINLLNFDTSKVRFMDGMFKGCSKLKILDLSSFDMTYSCNYQFPSGSKATLVDFIYLCSSLEYIKSPKAVPADSATNSDHAIKLPSQFSPYSGITELTADNLADHKVINLPGDKFIYEWKALRSEGGDNGICAALTSGTESNTKLKQLLTNYDSFDAETKEYVNKVTDKEDVTIENSVLYVKNVLNGTQGTEKDYGINNEDAGSYMTVSIIEESPYLIAIISLLGVLAVLGYYFYNKKKQAN